VAAIACTSTGLWFTQSLKSFAADHHGPSTIVLGYVPLWPASEPVNVNVRSSTQMRWRPPSEIPVMEWRRGRSHHAVPVRPCLFFSPQPYTHFILFPLFRLRHRELELTRELASTKNFTF
jgi:hypothetical protein